MLLQPFREPPLLVVVVMVKIMSVFSFEICRYPGQSDRTCSQYCCVKRTLLRRRYMYCCSNCRKSVYSTTREGPACRTNTKPHIIVSVIVLVVCIGGIAALVYFFCCRRRRRPIRVFGHQFGPSVQQVPPGNYIGPATCPPQSYPLMPCSPPPYQPMPNVPGPYPPGPNVSGPYPPPAPGPYPQAFGQYGSGYTQNPPYPPGTYPSAPHSPPYH